LDPGRAVRKTVLPYCRIRAARENEGRHRAGNFEEDAPIHR
jgi:hypothetical protein